MLGRKTYNQEEVDAGRSAIEKQLAGYRGLAGAVRAGETADKKLESALAEFEQTFFNNLVLMLDRYYVHRLRVSTGKDTNPLNEVEMIVDSLLNNNGVLRGINAIKYAPEKSVVKLNIGDEIRLTEDAFERLFAAFFEDLEHKFVQA